ncbi:hypothetical protein [Streptomyces olivaceoviridis]|uniref:hypothetical protein n=1 Tax=Streptomyces olivaceoviridis TaxID=1921 RepID=UPI00167A1683|nr:hypothetical protein [Streptomyces olivaceoviridis]
MRSGRTAVAVMLLLGAVACTARQPRWLTGTRGASLSCGTAPGGAAWLREAHQPACGPLSPR